MAFEEGNLARNMPPPPPKRPMRLVKNDEPAPVMLEQLDAVEEAPGEQLPSENAERAQRELAELAASDAEEALDVTSDVEELSPEEAARHGARKRTPRPSLRRAKAMRALGDLERSDKQAGALSEGRRGPENDGSLRAKAEAFRKQKALPDVSSALTPEPPSAERRARDQRLRSIRDRIAGIQEKGAKAKYYATASGQMARYDIARERERAAAADATAFEERQREPRMLAREHAEIAIQSRQERLEDIARVYRDEDGQIVGMMNLPNVSANDVMTAINHGALRRLTEDMEADVMTAKVQGRDPLEVLRSYKTQIDAWNNMREEAVRLTEEQGSVDEVVTNPVIENQLYREDEPPVPLSILENPETLASMNMEELRNLHEAATQRRERIDDALREIHKQEKPLMEKLSDKGIQAEQAVLNAIQSTQEEMVEIVKAIRGNLEIKKAELRMVENMSLDAFDEQGNELRAKLHNAEGVSHSLRSELKSLKKDPQRRQELQAALEESQTNEKTLKQAIVTWQRSDGYRELMDQAEAFQSAKKKHLEEDLAGAQPEALERIASIQKGIDFLEQKYHERVSAMDRTAIDLLRSQRSEGRALLLEQREDAERLQETLFSALLEKRKMDIKVFEEGVDITEEANEGWEEDVPLDELDEAAEAERDIEERPKKAA